MALLRAAIRTFRNERDDNCIPRRPSNWWNDSFLVCRREKKKKEKIPNQLPSTLHPPLFTFHWLPVVHPRNRSRVTGRRFSSDWNFPLRKFPRKWISPLYRINVTEFARIFDPESKKILMSMFGNTSRMNYSCLTISCLSSVESSRFFPTKIAKNWKRSSMDVSLITAKKYLYLGEGSFLHLPLIFGKI